MPADKPVSKKVKKKQWFQIVAPKLFNEQAVGETYLYSLSDAVGRTVKANLMNLTREIKAQNTNISLRINRVSGDKAYTEIVGYSMIPAAIKRMVRRGKTKLELSFVVETADHKKIRIKPIAVTQKLVKHSVSAGLDKAIKTAVEKNFRKSNYSVLMQSIVSHKFQGSLKKQLSKVYPLKIFEIKDMHVEKEAKAKGLSEEIIQQEIDAKEVKDQEEKKAEQKEAEKEEKKEKPKKAKKKKDKEEVKEEEPEEVKEEKVEEIEESE